MKGLIKRIVAAKAVLNSLREQHLAVNRCARRLGTAELHAERKLRALQILLYRAREVARDKRRMKAAMTQRWYKTTTTAGNAIYGRGSYHLPRGNKPGKWMSVTCKPMLCYCGYHAVRRRDLRSWLDKHFSHRIRLFEVQVAGEGAFGSNKAAFTKMRFLREIPKEKWHQFKRR